MNKRVTLVGYEVWLSLVERYVRDVEVVGSNPVTPIQRKITDNRNFSLIEGSVYFVGNPILKERRLGKMQCIIYTSDGAIYKRDPDYENSMDAVIQHMIASGFTKEEIQRQLRVDADYIEYVCKPSK